MSDATPTRKARRIEPLAVYEPDSQEVLDGLASGRLRLRRKTKDKGSAPVTLRERLEMIPLFAQQGATFNLSDDAMSPAQRERLREMHHRAPFTAELSRLGGAFVNPLNLLTGAMAARGKGVLGFKPATDGLQKAFNRATHAKLGSLPVFPSVSGAAQGAGFGYGAAEEETGQIDRLQNMGIGAGIGALAPLVLAPVTRGATLAVGSIGRLGPSRSTTLDGEVLAQRPLLKGGIAQGGRLGAGPEIRLRDRIKPRDVANLLLEEQAIARGGVNAIEGSVQPADVTSARAQAMLDDILALSDPADRKALEGVLRAPRRNAEIREQARDAFALGDLPTRRIDLRPRDRNVVARAGAGFGADDGAFETLMAGRNVARSARPDADLAAEVLPAGPARPALTLEPLPQRRAPERVQVAEEAPILIGRRSEPVAEMKAALAAEEAQRQAAIDRGAARAAIGKVKTAKARAARQARFDELDAVWRQRQAETAEAQDRLESARQRRTVGRDLEPEEVEAELARVAEINAARRAEAEAENARRAAMADEEYTRATGEVRGRNAAREAQYPEELDAWRRTGAPRDAARGKGALGDIRRSVQGRASDREVEDTFRATLGPLRERLSVEDRAGLRERLAAPAARRQVALMADRLGLPDLPRRVDQVSGRIGNARSTDGDTARVMTRRVAESGGREIGERGADVPLSERLLGDAEVTGRQPIRLNRREARAIVREAMRMRADGQAYGAGGSPRRPLPVIGKADDLFEVGPGRELPRRAGRIFDTGNLTVSKMLKSPLTMTAEAFVNGDGMFNEQRELRDFVDTDITTPEGFRINGEDTDALSDRVVFVDGEPVAVAPGEAERWRGEARDRRALRAALLERFGADDMGDDIGERSPDRKPAARFDQLGAAAQAEVKRAQSAVAQAQRALNATPRTEENKSEVSRNSAALSRARGALEAAKGRLTQLAERFPEEAAASGRYAAWNAEGEDLRRRAFAPVERPRR